MTDDKAILEAAKELGLDEVLPTIYLDLLSPAARELGDRLATIAKAVKIALAPLEAAVWGYDRIRDWLSLRVTNLLAERGAKDIKQPPLSVAGPLIMQMLFASEEPDLREMYAKLLTTSMDAQTTNVAHPSFVSVIAQLTPGEARILRHISTLNQEWPYWMGTHETDELEAAMRQMCAEAGITDEAAADLYIENLLRLRVLRRFGSFQAEFNEAYQHYRDEPAINNYNSDIIEVTCYGRALLQACVIDIVAHHDDVPDGGSNETHPV
jgi:hypothetical protein